MRVPAGEVEGLVLDRLRALLASPSELSEMLAPLALQARALDAALHRAADLGQQWRALPPENKRALTRQIVARVTLSLDRVTVAIGAAHLAQALEASVTFQGETEPAFILSIAAALRRAGQGKRMVIGEPFRQAIDSRFVGLLQEAFSARAMIFANSPESLNAMTSRLTKSKGRLTALMRVSYLAPGLINAILSGRQPPELSPKRLLRAAKDLPLDWSEQRRFLQFPELAAPRPS
jgi:hypothetical protein